MWTEQAISAYLGEHFWFVNQEGRTVDRYVPPQPPKQRVNPPRRKYPHNAFPWTPELDAKLMELRAQALRWSDIGEVIGCSRPTCRHRHGVLTGTRAARTIRLVNRLPADWRATVKMHREAGATWQECADVFGLMADTLRKMYTRTSGYKNLLKEAA